MACTCARARIPRPGRSPWTNEYTPSLPDGTRPSQRLRVLEQAANDAFSIYREQYYEGSGISSVYLWDVEDGAGTASASGGSGSSSSFAGVVLLKKQVGDSASWDSIHVFEVAERSRVGSYKLTSTVSFCLCDLLVAARPLPLLPVARS